MIRCGKMMVLNYEDITECLLENGALHIPEGCTQLMLHAGAIEQLNVNLGLSDDGDFDDEEEEP